jgi:FlaA1/EpsC-like NDP-sugar epimerase
MFSSKNFLRLFIDLTLLTVAFVLATVIRLEGQIISSADKFIWNVQLIKILPFVVLIELAVLISFGTYRRFWRYIRINDIVHLARSLAISSLVLVIPRFLGKSPNASDLLAISYGVLTINFLLAIGFLSTVRLLRFFLLEQKKIKRRLREISTTQKHALVIGAGEAGLEAVKAISTHPELGLKVVALLDDDPKKQGMVLYDEVKVCGYINDVKYWVNELAIDQIIIAIPSLKLSEKKRINLICTETGVDVRTIPGVDQLAGGRVTVEQIRKLSMEDLLGRDEIDLGGQDVIEFLNNKRILVTGAGGSIGKELCKQMFAKCNISAIALVGKGENSIFETWQDLNKIVSDYPEKASIVIDKRICDIRNYSRMSKIFSEFRPDVVFHAAAHKHVHLMEINPCEAFENNVIGTRNLAELAGINHANAFVLISTDKAVNPTSMMGATKNLAEKVTLLTSKKYPNTKYTAVRFGNVLGSRGSVIKVWEQQLANSVPLTITHKDAIRFFMTIPEAAQLVIQAGSKATNGEIMVLDMGEPVKIYDLVRQFIQLSGFTLDEVPVDVIGLRDGEKLYEELLTSDEFVDHKLTEKIYKAKINFNLDESSFNAQINDFTELAFTNQDEILKAKLKALANSISAVANQH